MANRKNLYVTLFQGILLLTIILIAGCAEDEEEVEPTLSSLWDNAFSGCALNCHSPDTPDGPDGLSVGPDMSTKAKFYDSLVSKSIADYPDWTNITPGCTFDYITPNDSDLTQSTLAGTLILSINNSIGCGTSYATHEANGVTITDKDVEAAFKSWVASGAPNN